MRPEVGSVENGVTVSKGEEKAGQSYKSEKPRGAGCQS